MQAENNNDIAITEAKLKDFLSSVLSSEGIVVDIRRTFIEYNGVNRSRVFARHANRMACKGSNEKFVVIALLCYPALQWLLKAQDIDALIEKLKEENEDESVWRMSNIQRILESSMGGCKPQLRLEMRKLFFARCQQLVDEIDEAMNKAVFMNPASKPSRISLAMAMLRGSILDSDPVTAVTIRNNFDSIVEDVTAIAGDAIKPLVMQLAPNEGEAKTAEAAYLYHNTEVLLREYSRIVNPSVADENRSLRILAQGGNTLESDARCHQAQVLVQYAQLIRGAIELVKDFPGDSKLYDVLTKGASVLVSGRFESGHYEKDGQKKFYDYLSAATIQHDVNGGFSEGLLMGNLTADVVTRNTQNGGTMVTFTVASNRSYQKNGNWENATSYVSCAANGKTAEFIAAHFHKGDPIMLVGVLTSNQYQNKDGQNRTSYTLWVEKASFASRKNASQNGAVPAANAAPAQAAPAAAPAAPAAPAVAQPSYGNYTGDDFADIDEDDLPF